MSDLKSQWEDFIEECEAPYQAPHLGVDLNAGVEDPNYGVETTELPELTQKEEQLVQCIFSKIEMCRKEKAAETSEGRNLFSAAQAVDRSWK